MNQYKTNMNKELAKPQKVVILQDGFQLWMDSERADVLAEKLKPLPFDASFDFDGRNITKAMYRGVFLPSDIEEQTRRKNGQWKCKNGGWHNRGDKSCDCIPKEQKTRLEAKNEVIKECGKCQNGYVPSDNFAGMRTCNCMIEFNKNNQPVQNSY